MSFLNEIVPNIQGMAHKILSNKYCSPKLNSILVILFVAICEACLLTFAAFIGMIFMFIGIGLLILLAEFILILVILIFAIVDLIGKKENKEREIGLLLGLLLTAIGVYAVFNPNMW